MVWNELQKIWNIRVVIVLIAVGAALFYSDVAGQMNLDYLPVFETVELEIGTQIVEKFGAELDDSDIAEMNKMYDKAVQELDEKIMAAYPQIKEWGFVSYAEFEREATEDLLAEEMAKTEWWELYVQISEEFAREQEVCNAYAAYINDNISIRILEIYDDKSEELEKRIQEIKNRDVISALPGQVMMNMSFVMENYANVLLILVILLVFPYVAMDNRNGVYSLVAVTKTGRRWTLHQIKAVLLSVTVLITICTMIFYLIYKAMTPYEVYSDCIVTELWFDWTWPQYFWIRIAILSVTAFAFSMICMYAASYCKTIVGTVAITIPCWGVSQLLRLYFIPDVFCLEGQSSILSFLFGIDKYMPVIVVLLLLGIGLFLLYRLYYRRKLQDII